MEAAHDLVDQGRFGDAQLFIDVQGFSEIGRPLSPAEALRRLLRPLVAANERLPESEQDLAARFREATRGFDMLLLIDNARDEAQVEPLLPGHRAGKVLITSRNRLSLRGLQPIDLAEMDSNEAAALAVKLAGRRDPNRITEAQATEIARLCGFLPLSIEVTANALAKTKGTDVAGYIQELGERAKPLKALEKAKAVLRLSVEALDADARERWTALGVFEGGFHAKAAADVWSVEDPGATLEELEQRSLVSFDPDAERYQLHDLLRAVALEELTRDLARQREVLRRHAEHFFAVLLTANALYRAGYDNVGRGLTLLDSELINLRSAQRWAADTMAQDEGAAKLAQAFPIHVCLTLRLPASEHLAWLGSSLAAAEKRGDVAGQARAASGLGVIYDTLGDFGRAEEMHKKSLALAEELGLKELMASGYSNLGVVYDTWRDFDRAEEMFRKGLAIEEELGRKEGMAADYGNLGVIYQAKGELDLAEGMYQLSLENSQAIGHKELNARQYANLGGLHMEQGDIQQAVTYWRKALVLLREIGAQPEIEKIERALRKIGVDPDRDEAAA